MTKIIKSVSADALYSDQSNKAQKIVNDKNSIFGNYTYLADNEEVYIIDGSGKEWIAYRCIAPNVENKTNFYDMVYCCKPTEEESEVFKTKKALTMAIEMNTITWKKWETIPKGFRKTNKLMILGQFSITEEGRGSRNWLKIISLLVFLMVLLIFFGFY